jgi:predicted ATPase/DNA-binding CsgD family transcriptional regulator
MAKILSGVEPLTGRESDVLACLADGLSNSEIAERLFLSPSTVKWYVRQLNSKLDTANRDEIVERARTTGLLDAPQDDFAPIKHNLPYQTTPFIGRDAELDELAHILKSPEVRLVTILAPGGMGKTRLALEAAEQQLYNFLNGVFFVPLQPLEEVEQIVPVIAQHTGFQFAQDERSLKQQILDYLRGKKLLLVVDNWEHLLDGAPLISEIIQAAPEVKVLATSREKLNLSGETVYALRGMQFPSWETPEDALRYDAVKLLVQAARRVRPDFAVTQDNLDYVARVCRLTEGMPLGILLATGWLDVLSLERIAEEIQKNVDFLETEMRDVPERQRSIRAIFEAAWERLTPSEQQVFMKLTVFRGGCTPEAAEAVTGAGLRTLQTLVNKALVLRTKTGRYDIHELLRQYGYEQLEASGSMADVLRQHSLYYANFLHEREDDLKGKRQMPATDEIEAELDNIRQAWYQALEDEDIARIGQSGFSLKSYVHFRSREVEFLSLFADAEAALGERYGEHRDYGRLLAFYGEDLFWLARYAEAEQMQRRALNIARAQDDPKGIVHSGLELARAIFDFGMKDEAWQLVEESIRISDMMGDDYHLALALFHQAYQLSMTKKHKEALETNYRALDIQKRLGDEVEASQTLNNIAAGLSQKGQYEEAEALSREILALKRRLKQPRGIAMALCNLVFFEFANDRIDTARRYTEEALQISREIADTRYIIMSLLHLSEINILTDQLDEGAQVQKEIMGMRFTNNDQRTFYLFNAGCICLGRQDPKGAITAFVSALKLEADPISLLVMGLAVDEEGRTERGIELAALAMNHPQFLKSYNKIPFIARHMAAIKGKLSEEAYGAAWERGKALDFEATVAELMAEYGGQTT